MPSSKREKRETGRKPSLSSDVVDLIRPVRLRDSLFNEGKSLDVRRRVAQARRVHLQCRRVGGRAGGRTMQLRSKQCAAGLARRCFVQGRRASRSPGRCHELRRGHSDVTSKCLILVGTAGAAKALCSLLQKLSGMGTRGSSVYGTKHKPTYVHTCYRSAECACLDGRAGELVEGGEEVHPACSRGTCQRHGC